MTSAEDGSARDAEAAPVKAARSACRLPTPPASSAGGVVPSPLRCELQRVGARHLVVRAARRDVALHIVSLCRAHVTAPDIPLAPRLPGVPADLQGVSRLTSGASRAAACCANKSTVL